AAGDPDRAQRRGQANRAGGLAPSGAALPEPARATPGARAGARRAPRLGGRSGQPDICSSARWRGSKNRGVEDRSAGHLEAGLGQIHDSPRDGGRVVLVVSRPAEGMRELPGAVLLDQESGLAGDNWLARGSKTTPDGAADPERQVTVMNARVAKLVAGGVDRMPLAGDQ